MLSLQSQCIASQKSFEENPAFGRQCLEHGGGLGGGGRNGPIFVVVGNSVVGLTTVEVKSPAVVVVIVTVETSFSSPTLSLRKATHWPCWHVPHVVL